MQGFEALLVLAQCHQNCHLLVLGQRALRVELFSQSEASERVLRVVAVRRGNAEVGPQDGRPLVYLLGLLEIVMRISKLLLFQVDVSETPPGVVVQLVYTQGRLIVFFARLVVFIGDEFVTAERVRIREVVVQLDGASEEF